MTSAIERVAARVLLVDGDARILLFRGGDPARMDAGTWWFTPGGGVEPGESWAQGATRELFEETGLRVSTDALGEPVHDEHSEFEWNDQVYSQDNLFFLLRVDAHEVDTSGYGELEVASIVEHRWWTLAELRATQDVVYPLDLVELLARLGV